MKAKIILKAKKRDVTDGDTLKTIATENGITWQQLAKFNWGSDDPKEINKFLYGIVGCRKMTKDGHNYIFSENDKNKGDGFIYVPEKFPEKDFGADSVHTITVKPIQRKTFIPSKCIARFRPRVDWKGEYGFDWMREGDSDFAVDAAYKDPPVNAISYDLLKTEYSPENLPYWKKNADGSAYEYLTAWLSLFPKDQTSGDGNKKQSKATIKIYYEIKDETPQSLRFVLNKKYLRLNKSEISPNGVGMYEKAAGMDIEIECIKEFKSDQEIEIWSDTIDKDGKYHTSLTGKLRILKNNKRNRYKANVVVINVLTNFNGSKTGSISGDETDLLEKHLLQSLTTLNLKSETLDLRNLNPLNPDELADKYTVLQNFIRKLNYNPGGEIPLHDYLVRKFKQKFTKDKKPFPYAKFYKIYVFDEEGGGLDSAGTFGLAGGVASAIPSPIKCAILFRLHLPSAAAHELFHTMGLYHPFSLNIKNKFQFGKGTTENIMDYTANDRIFSWKWQWDIIHPNLSKE